jgi:hypothetical protein
MSRRACTLPGEAGARAHTDDVPDWQSLAACVGSAPRLSGAACKGRSDLFDWHPLSDPHREADLETALQLCASCPALSQCKQWMAGLERAERPLGVMAGVLVAPKRQRVPTGRPRGRPPRHRVPA